MNKSEITPMDWAYLATLCIAGIALFPEKVREFSALSKKCAAQLSDEEMAKVTNDIKAKLSPELRERLDKPTTERENSTDYSGDYGAYGNDIPKGTYNV